MVALRNLEISEDEANILESLRANLNITMFEHEELMKELLRDTKLIKDAGPTQKVQRASRK